MHDVKASATHLTGWARIGPEPTLRDLLTAGGKVGLSCQGKRCEHRGRHDDAENPLAHLGHLPRTGPVNGAALGQSRRALTICQGLCSVT